VVIDFEPFGPVGLLLREGATREQIVAEMTRAGLDEVTVDDCRRGGTSSRCSSARRIVPRPPDAELGPRDERHGRCRAPFYDAGMEYTASSYRTVTPYLVVKDADAELRFLETAFGGTVGHCARDDAGRIMHAEIAMGDAMVMLGQGNEQWKPKDAAIYLWVPDVDATYAKALAAGATSESAPEDKPYGHRNAGVIDGNGITWWIAAPVRR